MSRTQNKNYKQAWRILIPVVSVILLAGIYIIYMPSKENPGSVIKSAVLQTENSFENVKIDHLNNDKLDSYFVTTSNKNKYQIHFIQKSKEHSYIQADGFSPRHRISLNIDKKTVLQNIPTDWAGRTEFDIPHKPDASLCLILNDEDISICNLSEKGRGDTA